jgi:hypothetical protein
MIAWALWWDLPPTLQNEVMEEFLYDHMTRLYHIYVHTFGDWLWLQGQVDHFNARLADLRSGLVV